jgi:hypothetical protein
MGKTRLCEEGHAMSALFISYRREDSAGWTGRLVERLKERFDEKSIFMDLDGIEPGIDFTIVLHNALESCDVLLAMIGPEWITTRDETGTLRLDDPADWVRTEIATALKRNIRVIPVLVGGAKVPTQNQLPDDLDPLAHRQAYELTDRRWNYDVEQLINTLPSRLIRFPLHTIKDLWSSKPVVIGGLVIAMLVSARFVLPSGDPLPSSQGHFPNTALPSTPGVVSRQEPPSKTWPHLINIGQETRLANHLTTCVYKVLAVQVDQTSDDTLSLGVTVRVTNEGPLNTDFGNDNFRMLVDNVPRTPTSTLDESVDPYSAKESTIMFTVPATTRQLALQLRMGDNMAMFPLDLSPLWM